LIEIEPILSGLKARGARPGNSANLQPTAASFA
jgi:hypothetical protein